MTQSATVEHSEVAPARDVVVPDRYGPESRFVDPLGTVGTMAGRWTFLPINGAAFLLQTMHPVIGDIVQEYSVAAVDPVGRAVRSMDSVQRWYFGEDSAIEEGYRLRAQHQPLQMRDAEGKHISALNPEAYAWVIATGARTITDSLPYELGRPLTPEDRAQVLVDSKKIADIVQVPNGQVPWVDGEFDRYYDAMVERLVAHPEALRILDNLQHGYPALPPEAGRFARAIEPALRALGIATNRAVYILTIGTLRPEAREILGATWTRRDHLAYRAVMSALRQTYRALPERVGYTPLAYHARGKARALRAMKGRDLPDFTAHQRERRAVAASGGCPFG